MQEPIRVCVAAANQHADLFALGRHINARGQRGQRGHAAGFGDHAGGGPKAALRLEHIGIRHDDILGNMGADDIHRQFANAGRPKPAGRDARDAEIRGQSALQGAVQRVGAGGFHGDNLDPPRIPGRHAADQTTATDGDKNRIKIRGLVFEFQPDRALAGDGFGRAIGMHRQRAVGFGIGFVFGHRLIDAALGNHNLGPEPAHSFQFNLDGDLGGHINP